MIISESSKALLFDNIHCFFVHSGTNGRIWGKWMHLGWKWKHLGENGCIWGKMDAFWGNYMHKWKKKINAFQGK
jgi:hypothetical protein